MIKLENKTIIDKSKYWDNELEGEGVRIRIRIRIFCLFLCGESHQTM